MLQLENQYPVWQDLKKRVIDTACKEISAKSDLELTYEIIKKGRTVVAIKLKVKQQQHQLSLY
jgi:plasmid replication initiation protein